MRRTAIALFSAVVAVPLCMSPQVAVAARPANPAAITAVTATPGPGVGEITFRWSSTGRSTTSFNLVTALNTFDRSNAGMPNGGRLSKVTAFSRTRRSATLSAHQVAVLGAGLASGNALFFRLYALNANRGGITVHAYPYQRAVLPRPAAPKARGTHLRIATFNVRTAHATGDSRTWNKRADSVAREIISHHPGVVALQELGPGRADGKSAPIQGTPRQTTSLLTALARNGGARYRLVRTTSYTAPGQPGSTQGGRILYDSSHYTLLTSCPETTAGRSYSSACSLPLPILRSDHANVQRRGGLAEFRDRSTGKRFWVASVHLDSRHSSSVATERRLDALRMAQADYAAARVAQHNVDHAPVIIGGDFNSWQNNRIGNSAHDRLVALGFYDASAATTRVNFQYTTLNEFKLRVPLSTHGVGVRLDMLMVKGAPGASRYENVMRVTNSARPSDHNLVLSDIVL